MKKKKPPIQLSLDMGNQDKIGLLVYNLALSSNTDEMHEAANVWRYKYAISQILEKLKKFEDYGFKYTKSTYDQIDNESSRLIETEEHFDNTCAISHIKEEIIKVINEELDGLDW